MMHKNLATQIVSHELLSDKNKFRQAKYCQSPTTLHSFVWFRLNYSQVHAPYRRLHRSLVMVDPDLSRCLHEVDWRQVFFELHKPVLNGNIDYWG